MSLQDQKFSFILPVRNGGDYVKICVNSILAQTRNDFNLVVLDNCSTDGTKEWVESLTNKNIAIFPADRALTIEENWARIVTVPKNDFITITGHDDYFDPGYLQAMADLIDLHPGAALYQAHFNFIDENGAVIRACKPIKALINPAEYFEGVLNNSLEVTGTGFMVRSREYDANGGIPDYPNLLYADIEIWMKLIRNSYMVVSAVNCFAFRFHLQNTSKSSGPFRLRAFERLINFFILFTRQYPELLPSLKKWGAVFMLGYVTGACHKLIYIPKSDRNGVTMEDIVVSAVTCAERLLPETNFNPGATRAVKMAMLIDNNKLLRRLFLFYKSFSKRTF